ncbi:hypothetical protein C2E23DRAFT_395020 [Lenzites betulinus]|nr:hypothetical protein C2E23DRAFT_395020 [Lenzites betulinus]
MAYSLPADSPDPISSPRDESAQYNHAMTAASHPYQQFYDFPWCPSCGPIIRALLAHANAYLPSCSSQEPPLTAESSGSLDAFVPVLVHRSQIAAVSDSTNRPTHDPTATSSTAFFQAPGVPPAESAPPRRTRGVKVACTHCRRSNKRCDEGRPCQRCVKCGMADSCANPSPKPSPHPHLSRNATHLEREIGSSGAGGSGCITETRHCDSGLNLPEDMLYPSPSRHVVSAAARSGHAPSDPQPSLGAHEGPVHADVRFGSSGSGGDILPEFYANYQPGALLSWPPTADTYDFYGATDPYARANNGPYGWESAAPSSS